jgi:hypothetical protein
MTPPGVFDAEDTVLVTRGVTSTVFGFNDAGEGAGRYGREGVGHVALFDLDDHLTPPDVEPTFREAGITGPTLLLESSAGSWHAWNLCVRPHPDTAAVLEAGGDDSSHKRIGTDRGFWRLRAGPKLRRNSDRYKKSPIFRGAFVVADSPDPPQYPLSYPHYELARKLWPGPMEAAAEQVAQYADVADPHGEVWVGDMLRTPMYATFTDAEKAIQRMSQSTRDAEWSP